MPKINQEEYEILKGLDDKWKWIARNNLYGGKLEAHTSKPTRMPDSHWSNGDMTLEFLGGEHQLQFIQWEDENPYNIAELIKEYEFGKILLAMAEEETVLELEYEREETEVKDIEWLKEELNIIEEEGKKVLEKNVDRSPTVYRFEERLHSVNVFRHLLNQLDEPEVLSQEEVNQAYKDGYEKGKQHTFYKGYLEGLADKESEPETVADVLANFHKSLERLKEVLGTEVEELEK